MYRELIAVSGGEPIAVPAKVLKGIVAVRESGEANMLNLRAVQTIARRLGYLDTVRWIEANQWLYIRGLIRGFVPELGWRVEGRMG